MSDKLEGKIVAVGDIPDRDRSSMFSLLCENFEGYEWDNFIADLEQKDVAILLKSTNQDIRGFSTVQLLTTQIDSRPVKAVYSGDTIIDREYWSRNELFQVWIPYVLEKKAQEPEIPLYWFLLCSGCRTYKYLPTFFKSFFPCAGEEDGMMSKVADTLATEKFGSDYHPDTGLVIFSHSQERLREGLAEVEPNQMSNPHVKYFLEKNPEYHQGHELVCLTELCRENFKPSILRRLGI